MLHRINCFYDWFGCRPSENRQATLQDRVASHSILDETQLTANTIHQQRCLSAIVAHAEPKSIFLLGNGVSSEAELSRQLLPTSQVHTARISRSLNQTVCGNAPLLELSGHVQQTGNLPEILDALGNHQGNYDCVFLSFEKTQPSLPVLTQLARHLLKKNGILIWNQKSSPFLNQDFVSFLHNQIEMHVLYSESSHADGIAYWREMEEHLFFEPQLAAA